MTLFIAYFSDIATEFDIKAQVRRESRYDHLNVDCKDGKIHVSNRFTYEADGIIKIVLDKNNNLVAGNYPVKELAEYPLNYGTVEKVRCGKRVYYLYDRSIVKKSDNGKLDIAAVVRTIASKESVASEYQSLKYVSYICVLIIALISTVVASTFSRQIAETIHDICETAEEIRTGQRFITAC